MLRLEDKWVWDFWTAFDEGVWHVFFLQADRTLLDPRLRHFNVSIGRATSRDLVNWRYQGTALRPGPSPSFDDGATWTGSVVRHDGRWWMFYTGNSVADGMKKQRIGLATSTDLATWTKHAGNPLFDLDSRWYEEHTTGRWHDRSWRDPWILPDPASDGWLMLFTARKPFGDADAAGVIGLARSDDLLHWTAEPPMLTPGFSGELEVPQLIELEGRWYLLFSASIPVLSRSWLAARPGFRRMTGTHAFVADAIEGPWAMMGDEFFAGDEVGSLYAGRILKTPDGPVFMAFRNTREDGSFSGELCDPIPIRIDGRGRLELDRQAEYPRRRPDSARGDAEGRERSELENA